MKLGEDLLHRGLQANASPAGLLTLGNYWQSQLDTKLVKRGTMGGQSDWWAKGKGKGNKVTREHRNQGR